MEALTISEQCADIIFADAGDSIIGKNNDSTCFNSSDISFVKINTTVSSSPSSSLPNGAIVGIAVGTAAGLAGVVATVYFAWRLGRRAGMRVTPESGLASQGSGEMDSVTRYHQYRLKPPFELGGNLRHELAGEASPGAALS